MGDQSLFGQTMWWEIDGWKGKQNSYLWSFGWMPEISKHYMTFQQGLLERGTSWNGPLVILQGIFSSSYFIWFTQRLSTMEHLPWITEPGGQQITMSKEVIELIFKLLHFPKDQTFGSMYDIWTVYPKSIYFVGQRCTKIFWLVKNY